jgi:hypothetical protein
MGVRASAAVLAAAGAAIAAFVSCRQIVGISDNPATDLAPTTAACGLPCETSVCASCVQANCCAESTACAGDVACAGYFRCFYACKLDDWPCRAQCVKDHPIGGAAEFPGLAICSAAHCPSECGLVCGSQGAILSSRPDAATGCEACFESSTSWCASARGCDTSAACIGWEQCYGGCTTPDCRTQCASRFALEGGIAGTASPFGIIPPELSSSINGVGNGPCAGPCSTGSDWSCLDHGTWPNSTLGGTTLETQVLDVTAGKGVAGVSVAICQFGDPTCGSPLNPVPAQSDANGFVKVSVPPGASLIDTVGPDTFVKFSSPTIFPLLYFLGYPVSEPVAPIASPYVLVNSTSNPPPGWDTSLGFINAVPVDCFGAGAPGVKITTDAADAGVIPYCFENSSAVTTGISVSTPNGAGYGCGFVNMPPGTVTVTATPIALGKPSSHLQVLVQPGTITNVFLSPSLTQ